MWSELIGGILFVGYVGTTLRTFIKASTPPVCAALGSECVAPGIGLGDDYVVHLHGSDFAPQEFSRSYDSELESMMLYPKGDGESVHIGSIKTKVGFESDCDATSILAGVGSVETAKASWLGAVWRKVTGKRQCVALLEFSPMESWLTNSTRIFVSVIPSLAERYDQLSFSPSRSPVSLMYQPEKRDRARKRFLLSGVESRAGFTDPYMAFPPEVRVGPIFVAGNFNSTQLLTLGKRHWLRRDRDGGLKYYPDALVETYVSPRDEYIPQDGEIRHIRAVVANKKFDVDHPSIRLSLSDVSWRKHAVEQLMMSAMGRMERQFGTTQYDSDSLKLLFAGQSPIILLVTFLVSVLHALFEMLAMASSWSNFRQTCKSQDMAQQMSSRAILLDTVLEVLILAWLYDEGEAKLVQLLLALKVVFNAWRWWRLAGVQKKQQTETVGLAGTEIGEGRGNMSEVKENRITVFKLVRTVNPLDALRPERLRVQRELLDADTFELWSLVCLSLLLLPVLAAWAVYQVAWQPQKGWFSVAVLLGAHTAYAGGFIAMTPQLYKNYYYRSVTHLPWVALTYNFLNTIIDDLFSFLIRMPKAHRISVFRDDVIFVIYWLQKIHYAKQQKTAERPNALKQPKAIPEEERMPFIKSSVELKSRRPKTVHSSKAVHS
ncbi:cleft lip and palate transmembrane protein 1 [Gregarina niphandrodes]|uniref:Cleft lip and palate transmembrane protein 1 n=1 Tax=Gregarina niphandrodes TaxID=110365 RepID=A0A023BCB6_GRENI|nr:cleft lip and palate transmembrane protein 1 [Gregarina niphandrodes]EZG83578.1 cleft lip and palate transmembrane protein 1 [Gregarina niphandrodes]|eukprot:XP_011128939.1 cleft lip and palate transmembrane protein 1 [Gregarina niphandrodes]